MRQRHNTQGRLENRYNLGRVEEGGERHKSIEYSIRLLLIQTGQTSSLESSLNHKERSLPFQKTRVPFPAPTLSRYTCSGRAGLPDPTFMRMLR